MRISMGVCAFVFDYFFLDNSPLYVFCYAYCSLTLPYLQPVQRIFFHFINIHELKISKPCAQRNILCLNLDFCFLERRKELASKQATK